MENSVEIFYQSANIMVRSVILYLLFLLALLETNSHAFGQTTSFPIKDWVEKLGTEKDINNENFRAITYQLYHGDSNAIHLALTELDKNLASKNLFYRARLHCLEAMLTSRSDYPNGEPEVQKLLAEALKEAYQTEDENLVSYMSWRYGVEMFTYKQIDLAATYCLRAVELNKNFLNQAYGHNYSALLGEILFHCSEYEKCIYYSRWSIANWPDTSAVKDSYCTILWNTIGQAYQKLGIPDSAMSGFEQSMALANKTNTETWKAINSGYEGQILFLKKEYEKAKGLLTYDYSVDKNADLNIAANSLQWLAKINLVQGKKDSALWQAKEALRLLSISAPGFQQKSYFLQETFYTTADIYHALGKTDSFYRYSHLYATLHDSLARVMALSSIDISDLRNNDEKDFYAIQVLQREKQVQLQQRNLIIIAILFLAAVALLVINRQRLKLKYRNQLAEQEKLRAGQEMESARSQLQMFTQSIVEKTNLIEHLEQEVQHKTASAERQQLITDLGNQTILTEEDWDKFKSLFEKIFPLFFQRLKNVVVDITMAEQRIAALTRLQLTTKQMAAVLGISPNSVNKAKHRLRLRVNSKTDESIEKLISEI